MAEAQSTARRRAALPRRSTNELPDARGGDGVLQGLLKVEAEFERRSQELAVAWRRGRAAFVLDQLSGEGSLCAALLAIRIHDLLARWDPVEGRRPVSFWRAIVARSEGWLSEEELEELDGEYRRRFGVSPPATTAPRTHPQQTKDPRRSLEDRARRIQEALELGEPIPRQPCKGSGPVEFMRRRSGVS